MEEEESVAGVVAREVAALTLTRCAAEGAIEDTSVIGTPQWTLLLWKRSWRKALTLTLFRVVRGGARAFCIPLGCIAGGSAYGGRASPSAAGAPTMSSM